MKENLTTFLNVLTTFLNVLLVVRRLAPPKNADKASVTINKNTLEKQQLQPREEKADAFQSEELWTVKTMTG